jgi:hypothetical protein
VIFSSDEIYQSLVKTIEVSGLSKIFSTQHAVESTHNLDSTVINITQSTQLKAQVRYSIYPKNRRILEIYAKPGECV